MTKILTIDLRSTAPRMLGSRGTPSQFVLYGLKNMCAKFDAFTRFVTIFPLTDRTIWKAQDDISRTNSQIRNKVVCQLTSFNSDAFHHGVMNSFFVRMRRGHFC